MADLITMITPVITQVFTTVSTACSTILNTPLLALGIGFFVVGGSIGILGRLLRRG